MPLHVRAGAIVPMGPIKQYVDEPVDAPLSVTIYPGADGAFELYEDDGRTFKCNQQSAISKSQISNRFTQLTIAESATVTKSSIANPAIYFCP